MTKERKIAITIWHELRELIETGKIECEDDLLNYKKSLCADFGVNWMHGCWFCQYVRRDYKRHGDLWEGTGKGISQQGCELCPLAKNNPEYKKENDYDCGCTCNNAPFDYVLDPDDKYPTSLKLKGCDDIIKALGGENG